MTREPLPPINFTSLADALLTRAKDLLPEWLPGGVLVGHEYECGSLAGGKGDSCKVNVTTGKWCDFSTGESGRDLLDLYAEIHGLKVSKAAAQVAREEGLESVAGIVMGAPAGAPAPKPPRPEPPPRPVVEKECWETIQPVPEHAVPPSFWHPAPKGREPDKIEHTARYQVGPVLWGYVVRFIKSDGDKLTLPYVYSRSQRDGSEAWKWRGWDDPRPLYFPSHRAPESRTVVLVEGERKADCLQQLLDAGAPGVYCVASWPGGSNGWPKADWSWLAGCTVVLWPDCDSLREKLTRQELKDTPDPLAREKLLAAKPYLPFDKQPGQKAMLGIGEVLRDTHGCTVQMLPIDKPGIKPSGWDCRDAIETDGWDIDRVLAYFGTARALLADVSSPTAAAGGAGGGEPPKKRDPSAGAGTDPGGPGGGDDGEDPFGEWLDDEVARLRLRGRWLLKPRRAALIEALRSAPALAGCVAFDELREQPVAVRAFPWRKAPGPLEDADVLRLADYVETTYGTGEASAQTTEQAINVAADMNRVHPFRDWVKAQQWDEVPRLEKWLVHVLGKTPDDYKPRRLRYLQLVGKYILMGHVARVMEPGCKFDYSVVLEGTGGIGKSTLINTLVGLDFFSDTHFDIGTGKDSYEQIAGIVAYELSEMTAFRRADAEAVKAFFSSRKDRYRGAYGRYVQDHPRQVVIWCTTNKRQYLFDITGNRRFWPVLVPGRANLVWLQKFRGQLFAEALHLYLAGERYFPSPEDEEIYFRPEQELRLVETGVQGRLWALLTREGAPAAEGAAQKGYSVNTTFVTIADLVQALGADPGKSSPMLEGQVRDWLNENGWEYLRETSGQRRRGYMRPQVWPPVIAEDKEADQAHAPGDQDQQQPVEPAAAPWAGGDDYAPI
ncbi:virulence protein E [Paracidovorax citrulli]|uniref:Virulence-associated E family protein n=1 Tax=Paracidovorax citrulli (strain AAC00-1) TaxID=397945 RepID=A1TML1_PARC0|nr:VapE domain-containing protein [Paracidovorax citrulli]ABM32199.1 virulence-associated E family protein [Paracidovorax citrulli AAC00-1]ATG94785.1 virulence protein E [Paracidovorax citrulli]PVY66391.1 virulence-associated protein E [Paracidovorax citrulli]REG69438.1 virulence-associated protein E [Paracidovorax citrulli]RLJ93992.1 virulence-associated protein E [Paracidovorax citrulli]